MSNLATAPPCKDCKDKRTYGCHDSCELYHLWKMHREKIKDAMRKDKEDFFPIKHWR